MVLADKSQFGEHHTFQHCSNTNKHAKCLSFSINSKSMWMDKLYDVYKSQSITTASSFAFSAIAFRFPQLLKRDTNMVASYCMIP